MKNISLLGSTGSIGRSSLEVVRRNRDKFRIVALTAGKNIAELKNQIEEFKPLAVSVIDESHARELKAHLSSSAGLDILYGSKGYCQVASLENADMVISAMVGAAGLLPTLAAIDAGKDIALANKETLVMAGQLVMEKAKIKGVALLPVDSEHSAVFQCLAGQRRQGVRRILLTASGGPFFRFSRERLETVKPTDALKHPNWRMGNKITIDSATMMNKGLEVIEACHLYGLPVERVDVLVHPQSIVHSLAEFVDGSQLAHLGVPDMRIPIAHCLCFPRRVGLDMPRLDLAQVGGLTFERADEELFPCLRLAKEAFAESPSHPAVLNAANEAAVELFLDGRIGFLDIPRLIEAELARHAALTETASAAELLAADAETRTRLREAAKA